jgi:glycosyltransferase involved in cell wall biosynthesis
MIDVVLPCLDEAEALPWVLGRLGADARAIVVDNGSTDGSAALARSLGATVIECVRRGYGAACHAGLEAATAEFVAFCDCDGSIDPLDLEDFAAPVLEGTADLVVGRRRPVTFGSWPLHARLANRELARRIRRRTDLNLRDIGPLRVAGRSDLLSLGQSDRRSGYPVETVLLAAKANWRIVGCDVAYRPRSGKSKVTGTVRGTVQAYRDISTIMAGS